MAASKATPATYNMQALRVLSHQIDTLRGVQNGLPLGVVSILLTVAAHEAAHPEEPLTLTELAQRVDMSLSMTSRWVHALSGTGNAQSEVGQALSDSGYLRTLRASDFKHKNVQITPKGVALISKLVQG